MDTIAKIAAVAATSGATWAAFKALEETASPITREYVSRWLQSHRLSTDQTSNIQDVLFLTFKFFYSENIFSGKFLIRSLITSIFGAIVLYSIIAIATITLLPLLSPEHFGTIPSEFSTAWQEDVKKQGSSAIVIVKFFGRAIPFTIIIVLSCGAIDYLSLCKSWLLLCHAHETLNWKRVYLLDLVLTLFISLGWAIFWTMMGYFAKKLLNLERLEYDPSTYAAYGLVTTWAPTFLIGAFLLLSGLAKAVSIMLTPIEAIKSNLLDVEGKPFQSIGLLSAIAIIPITSLVLYIVA